MSKNIDKVIDDFVVPEMSYTPEYEKRKSKNKTVVPVTIDDVPEIVLPKTKAEVYNEAKGRLKQKSPAAQKRTTVEKSRPKIETAAADAFFDSETKTVSYRDRSKPVADPVWVGGADELVPFAWRNPLIADIKSPSKYYRTAVREARELLLPVPHNK